MKSLSSCSATSMTFLNAFVTTSDSGDVCTLKLEHQRHLAFLVIVSNSWGVMVDDIDQFGHHHLREGLALEEQFIYKIVYKSYWKSTYYRDQNKH